MGMSDDVISELRRASSIGTSPPPLARSSTRIGRPPASRASRAISGQRIDALALMRLIRPSPSRASEWAPSPIPG